MADAIVQLYGGVPEEWETTGEDGLEVLTNAKSVGIVIDSPAAIRADMRQYANSALFHHCDGVEYISPEEDKGNPCGCPREFQARKALAKKGGPKPNTDVRFRLSDDPELGVFRFVSASWDLVKSLPHVTEDMNEVGGRVKAELVMEPVSFEAKSGPMAGQTVNYTKPVIFVQGPAD